MHDDFLSMDSEGSDRRTFLGQSLATMLLAGAIGSSSKSVAEEAAEVGIAPKGSTLRFFPGFEAIRLSTSEATINGVMGGSGPPLLLLQGFPQTHVEWHRLAPMLAKHFTVVATDMRGYGDSSRPADGKNHEGYSKRAMARDQVELMKALGYERFAVIGHDRGGRAAHRMALDYPEAVTKLVVLDIVPTHKLFNTVSRSLATVYYHFFLFLQPSPFPETLFGSNEDFVLRNWAFKGLIPSVITEDAFLEYLRCFKNPATLHSMIEDYRAAATIDLEHDETDLAIKVRSPLLSLWGGKGAMQPLYDVLATWRERAVDVRGKPLPGGHWLPEQVPDEVYAEVMPFLTEV